MITTDEIRQFVQKLKDIDRRFPEFDLATDIEKIEKLLAEIERQPTEAAHIAIFKSPKVFGET